VILCINLRDVRNTKFISVSPSLNFPGSFYEMAATRNYIPDLSGNARDFHKAKWICQNRKYPADPPAEFYQDALYEIP
jgi:hypothetical protein